MVVIVNQITILAYLLLPMNNITFSGPPPFASKILEVVMYTKISYESMEVVVDFNA